MRKIVSVTFDEARYLQKKFKVEIISVSKIDGTTCEIGFSEEVDTDLLLATAAEKEQEEEKIKAEKENLVVVFGTSIIAEITTQILIYEAMVNRPAEYVDIDDKDLENETEVLSYAEKQLKEVDKLLKKLIKKEKK